MAPITIRRLFPDMHHLLAEILHRHLRAIIRAVGAVNPNALNRQQARRAAYVGATRTLGATTEAHLLLIRDRHLLPPDEREPIEAIRASIGLALAGPHAQPALAMLDSPELTAQDIEAALTAITTRPATRPPQPLNQQTHQPRPLTPTRPSPGDATRPRAGPH